MPTPCTRSIAVIGSFRRHYEPVLEAIQTFRRAGLVVTSPLGDEIVEPGIEFVRFSSDRVDWGSPQVQTLALHRILRAELTYVVAPGGYVGRTTCYEIGRVVQADRPLYFSEHPHDLPVHVPDSHVLPASELSSRIASQTPVPLHANEGGELAQWERRLLTGDYLRS